MPEIVEVDPHDGPLLRRYWEVEQAAQRHDRPWAVLRTYDALAMVGEKQAYFDHVLLAALEDGEVVGTADIGLSLADNLHLAETEIDVLPDQRRRGIGTALLEAVLSRCRGERRTTVLGEAHVPHDSRPDSAPSYAFARSRGFSSVHVEDHLLLELPATPPGETDPAGYRILTWGSRTPEEYVDAYCAMRTQMLNDVPTGGVDVEPVVLDADRLHTMESRTERLYDRVLAVAQTGDGGFAGYSLVYLPHGTTEGIQDDTLVMPGHRGHRLGTALKLATLDVIRRDHPGCVALHTWTAVENHAMQRTNRDFGYRPVERMHDMQMKLADA
jgi:GNAT superfamily N-acetyltransferase